jgi:hypothetical protein
VLHAGFSHVSDDDYARTVISEQFAHRPRFDPSGTSWLPLPFWIGGAAMVVLGRTLASARTIACVLGAASIAAPYAAMRAARLPRLAAVIATAIALAVPWNAWLGVATVPDGWTGALIGAATVSMAAGAEADAGRGERGRGRPAAAAALLAASLSRYEAWPVCAVFAAWCVVGAIGCPPGFEARERSRGTRRQQVTCALVAIAGPLLWMAWNAHAHGSAFHFVARVTAFRRAIGAADVSLAEKVLGYPRALVEQTPEAAALGLCGAIGLVVDTALRKRWGWAAGAATALMAFLIAGDLGDGAPTHHPARALGSLWWVLVTMGTGAIAAGWHTVRGRRARVAVATGAAGLMLAWSASLPSRWRDGPGGGELERRDVQIARGVDLRTRGVLAAEVTPCAFEHFALLAAWGEPERARILPRTGAAPTNLCPLVVERIP